MACKVPRIRKNSIRALLGVNISISRPVTMLRARPHAIHFKPILDFETYCRLSKVLASRAIHGVMDSSWEMFFW